MVPRSFSIYFRLLYPLSYRGDVKVAPALRHKLHREALVKATDPEVAPDELLCSNPREGGKSDPAIQQTNDEASLFPFSDSCVTSIQAAGAGEG